MFSPLRNRAGNRFREPFGKAGLTVAVIAFVFAMLGGAYAATSSGGGGKATASAKAKQGPRGPRGKTGLAGPAGPQGPAGANGAKGDAGAKGDTGNAGAPGKDGESVTVTESAVAIEGHCNGTSAGLGGAKFVVGASKAYACNGKNGTTGFTETLPSNKTETGMWGTSLSTAGSPNSPISFPIPLGESPKLVFVSMVKYFEFSEEFFEPELKEVQEEGAENGCPGINAEGLPMADPGTLCVYGDFLLSMKPTGTGLVRTKLPNGPPAEPEQIFLDGGFTAKPEQNGEPGGSGPIPGAGPTGTTLTFECTASCQGYGVWAVTAE
jgi:Collagen triple helix repeat (20 copies)